MRELSDASIDLIRRKLSRLAAEVTELAELDAELPSERRRSVGIALALRPWVFSVAEAMRTRDEGAGGAGTKATTRRTRPRRPG